MHFFKLYANDTGAPRCSAMLLYNLLPSYIADICGFGDLAYMEKRIKKFNPRGALPREMKKNRGTHIKNWPFSIKSRSEYENISKHFFAYGL